MSTRILLVMLLVMLAGLLSSNMILKKQYDELDKSDLYWTYDKVLEQPFKHLHITGGNGTNIYYEPSSKPSVRLLHEWVKYHGGNIKTDIRNDTLYIDFSFEPVNSFEKAWLENNAPVRIFSPELLSVTGNNTRFEMDMVKQKSIAVHLTGKSKFEVESLNKTFDSIEVYQRDSSEAIFEMSPEFQTMINEKKVLTPQSVTIDNETTPLNANEPMMIKSIKADIGGYSILDVGHAQVQNLQLQVQDSSAIILSGNALRKTH